MKWGGLPRSPYGGVQRDPCTPRGQARAQARARSGTACPGIAEALGGIDQAHALPAAQCVRSLIQEQGCSAGTTGAPNPPGNHAEGQGAGLEPKGLATQATARATPLEAKGGPARMPTDGGLHRKAPNVLGDFPEVVNRPSSQSWAMWKDRWTSVVERVLGWFEVWPLESSKAPRRAPAGVGQRAGNSYAPEYSRGGMSVFTAPGAPNDPSPLLVRFYGGTVASGVPS